jgi:uncharacterized protein YegP (UPF0339 family)
MIHISRTKNGLFQVTNVADNGEVLKHSEALESKQAAWKNIKAELKACYDTYTGYDIVAICQDNTLKNPVVYLVGKKRIVANGIKPQTPHVPK